MIQKVKITRVVIQDKKKDGTPYKTAAGKQFWRVGIQTEQTGEVYYSTNAFAEDDKAMKLQVGQEVTVNLTEENGYNNFSLPTKTDLLEERVSALEAKVFGAGVPVVEEEINIDDF
jgi:hypothetical protein